MKQQIIEALASVLIAYDKIIGLKLQSIKQRINSIRFSHKITFRGGKTITIRKDAKIINPQWIEVGENLTIGDRVTFSTWPLSDSKSNQIKLFVGNNCRFGDDSHITAANHIEIGDNFLSGKKVLITDNSHRNVTPDELSIAPVKRKIVSKGPVYIGNNVWVGENAAILPGVTIGDGAIIGANAIVTQNIPPGGIAVGNPAKIIKILNPQNNES